MRSVAVFLVGLAVTVSGVAQAPLLNGAGGVERGASVTLPDGFFLVDVAGGIRFDFPVATVASPSGDFYVVEKAGVVRVVRDGAVLTQPFIDLREEVLNADDRGLLGFVLDPDFETNRYVYLSYVVAENGVETAPDGENSRVDAFARVTRYTASLSGERARLGTRRVLIGETWAAGIPACHHSHSIGTVQFGNDGSLLVGAGDAGQYIGVDAGGRYPECFGVGPQGEERFPESENIGAFRAQRLESLSGKILRVDAETGLGLSDNPFWTGNPNDNASRVWALGLRNPFRFTVGDGPGPGIIYTADVGFETWEEMNEVHRGDNLGWPCFEGPAPVPAYQAAAPASNGCDTVTGESAPRYWWNHADPADSNPPGRVGFSVVGGAVYTGTRYPAEYRDRIFYGDYAMRWIATSAVGADGSLSGDQRFSTGVGYVVHVGYNASTQWLTLTDVGTGPGEGRVWELRHVDGEQNSAPVAQAGADVTQGTAPLAVTFSGSGSFDPDGDTFTHLWTFGDDAISTEPDPAHIYTAAGTYVARLTVTDGAGASSSSAIPITVRDGTAPTATILSPTEGHIITTADFESGEAALMLVGEGNDPDQGAESLGYAWDVALLHNSHVHPDVFSASGPTATYSVEPHGVGGDFYAIRIRLTVTDAEGLEDTAERIVPFEDNDGGSLPPGWTSQTLGVPAIAGSAFLTDDGAFRLRGSGDLWGFDDAAHLVTRDLTGDATVTARVASVTGGDTDGGAKAGVILRNDLDPRGPYAMMYLSPDQGVRFQWRAAPDSETLAASEQIESPASVWVRLERRGEQVRGLSSADGLTWTLVHEIELPLQETVLAGLAVTATDINAAGSIANAVFTEVGVAGQGGAPPPFASLDLGAPAVPGSATGGGGLVEMTGAGDLWGQDDAAHLAYWTFSGDGVLSARLDALNGGDPGGNAKAGLLVRASLDPRAPYAMMASSATGGLRFQSRTADGGITQSINGDPPGSSPVWLQIERAGNVLTGSSSPDGTVWTTFGAATIALPPDIVIGLAVTATDIDAQGLVAAATFSKVSVSPGVRTPVATDELAARPSTLGIVSVFPNPTRAQARVQLHLSEPGRVAVHLLDALGRTIAERSIDDSTPGDHAVVFDLSGVAPGVYVVRARSADGDIAHRRLTVVR